MFIRLFETLVTFLASMKMIYLKCWYLAYLADNLISTRLMTAAEICHLRYESWELLASSGLTSSGTSRHWDWDWDWDWDWPQESRVKRQALNQFDNWFYGSSYIFKLFTDDLLQSLQTQNNIALNFSILHQIEDTTGVGQRGL